MDLIPVIYHNFELYTSIVKKKKGTPAEQGQALVKMPLKNLTLDQLQSLKVRLEA